MSSQTSPKNGKGRKIKEMIEVWGDPKILNQVSSSGGARRMHCEATANFNSQGTITTVDVVSQYCKPDRRSNMEDLRRKCSAEARIADRQSRNKEGRP